MHPHISVLFIIIFSFVHRASADFQDSETQPDFTTETDTHARWAEFVSFLVPANVAEKVQDGSFFSHFLGNRFPEKSGNVQCEPQAPLDSLHFRPEQSLEALLSEETGKVIRSLETMINSTIALGMALYDVIESGCSNGSSAPLNPLLKNIANLVVAARDDFQARFPFPATAPGHTARVKNVSAALEHLQRFFIRFARNRGVEQELIERYISHARPLLHDVSVLIGDVSELYPAAIEALVLNLSAVLLPEAAFLRSLVILYCLGPYVLGRDAINGWLLKHASEVFWV